MINKKMGFIGIIVVIIILYYYFFNSKKFVRLLGEPELFKEDKVKIINSNKIKNSKIGFQYSFSFWYRLNNINTNSLWGNNIDEPKILIDNNGSPNVLYLINDNILRIQIAYNGYENIINYYNFDIENIKHQKWNNIVIIVNNDKVQIYNNGVLVKSNKLYNPNIKNLKVMKLGDEINNFNGYLGYLDYYNYILDRNTIKQLYFNNLKILSLNVINL